MTPKGLVGAIRSQVARLGSDDLGLTIDGPEDLPPLRAAVEVAAYRIALEALTNVVRHAEACNCRIRVALDEETATLCLEAEDDGLGVGEDYRAGVGLTSMRERAEELGGSCTVKPVPFGGTRVRALLPYALDEAVESEAS